MRSLRCDRPRGLVSRLLPPVGVRWMLGRGVGIAVMCAPRITVAPVVDRRCEPSLPTAHLMPRSIPPFIAHRLLNAPASLRHRTAGLPIHGPRAQRVTWDLAHDRAPGAAGPPAASHRQGHISWTGTDEFARSRRS